MAARPFIPALCCAEQHQLDFIYVTNMLYQNTENTTVYTVHEMNKCEKYFMRVPGPPNLF